MDFLDYNNDGKINLQDIYDVIVDFMNKQSKRNIHGEDKKDNVLKYLKLYLPTETYDRFFPMIDKFIDFIFNIAQNPKLLKHLKKTCKICPCIK